MPYPAGEFSRSVLWAHGEVVFPAGSAIVAMQAGSGRQRHLLGHARPVVALALDAAGSVLASAEEGGEGVVRLWDLTSGTCFATLVTGGCWAVEHTLLQATGSLSGGSRQPAAKAVVKRELARFTAPCRPQRRGGLPGRVAGRQPAGRRRHGRPWEAGAGAVRRLPVQARGAA